MDAKAYYESVREDREAWRSEQVQACAWCGDGSGPLEIHEISRRSQSQRSWGHRCNYLLICGGLSKNKCHDKVFDSLPILTQLAVKKCKNPGDFSLTEWLKLSGRMGVTEEEVDKVVGLLKLPELHPQHYPAF